MNENVIIGVDIGTTSTKTMAFDAEGRILAQSSQDYSLYTESDGHVEQDPEEIFRAVEGTIADVAEKVKDRNGTVEGISFSAAMHSLIAVDENGNPLTRSITWADQRSSREAEQLKASSKGQEIYKRTGTPIHPMSPLTKLIWFDKNEPELKAAAAKWISIKEYLFYKWFGEFIVDHSIASATGLFHLRRLDWDDEALHLAGIRRGQLSKPVSTQFSIGGLSDRKAKQLGIDPQTPFIIGASDGVLANLGVGAIKPGSIACSIGTSGAVRTVVPEPSTDREGRTFCYALTENHWVVGGPINNGGIAFRWLRDNVFDDLAETVSDPYEYLTKQAETIHPGADGLLFLPYLTGERAPFWNADTKAVFFGLTLNHNRNHMIRAVLEGVLYQLDMVVAALKTADVEPMEFRATGGFTKSRAWRQMMADIFAADIFVPASNSSACFGAAMLAMKALHWIDDFSTAVAKVQLQHRHVPIVENVKIYESYKPIFHRLAESLQPEFSALSELTKKRK
ncbi:MAG TPA: FGGY family carbohydrate kinase [Bacillales bacterium]|nr:FGGY family carbohydrate kinase [Bacillales bacterium]